MRSKFVLLIGTLLILSSVATAQQVIKLPVDPATATPTSSNREKEKDYYSDIWRTQVITNVSEPTLLVYKPEKQDTLKTAVIICPGGGFHALSINSEGIDVAKWLNAKGITAFVLKYRLVPSGEDGVKEFITRLSKQGDPKIEEDIRNYRKIAIADGKEAIKYVRQHAAELGVATNRIGIVGFSAGGHVVAGTALEYTPETRPDYAAPIYLYLGPLKDLPVPADAPPMFIAAATNDNLALAPASIEMYNKWLGAKKSVELHIYAKGGHGFGMRTLNLPSDTWIQRFYDWLELFNGKF